MPLTHLMNKNRGKKSWMGIPPWIVIGSVTILLPIFVFWTLENINRQKSTITHLLLEKGAALIRSFEAGTRTGMSGMMGMRAESFQLQRLLQEISQQPDIAYIMITDLNGTITAHSEKAQIGKTHGQNMDLEDLYRSGELRWRRVPSSEGSDTFEVFRRFSPRKIVRRIRTGRVTLDVEPQRYVIPNDSDQKSAQIIFVGLDMEQIETARKNDIRHTVIMAAILLLIGFGGISLLFFVQVYRSTRSSLSRIKAFSDNVVENMPIGLVALDADGKIASFNQAAEIILQISSPDIMDKNADETLPPQLTAFLNEITAPEKTIDREIDYNPSSGISVPLEVSASRLEGDDGSFLGHVILFRDLTEVQSLKREIERSQRLASIGRLAAGVAHEIRNPLSSIKGFATYFGERYRAVPEDKKTAEIMVQEVERLNRVIGQLLEFARPVRIQRKSTSIRTLVHHSLKMIEKKAAERSISINTNIPDDLKDISIDADMINQVLLNLYLNAIEAMEHGGELTVDIDQAVDPQRLKLTISDTGRGIDKKDLSNIFDPYFTTKQSGTGLGLAIVHKIIESHHGEIIVESDPGEGTIVTILLPY